MLGSAEDDGGGGAAGGGRRGPLTLLALVGLAALVAAVAAGPGRGGAGWLAVGLLVVGLAAGVVAVVVRPGPGRAAAGLAGWLVVLAATVVAGWGLVGLAAPDDPVDRLVWAAPAPVRYPAALLVPAVLGALALVLVVRRLPVVAALVVGIATVAVATGAGARWADHDAGLATQSLDHRHGAPLDPLARQDAYREGADGAAGPGPGMHRLWSDPGAGRTFLVRGTDLVMTVVAGDHGRGRASTGVAVLDAATGEERWHLLLPRPASLEGVAVSPQFGRVVVVFRDVAVALDLHTGAELWHRLLPGDAGGGPDAHSVVRVVGAPLRGGLPDLVADRVVPAFSRTVLVEQHVLRPSGEDDAGRLMTLDIDGAVHLVERPPATRCRYAADYDPEGATATVLRDGLGGACGPVELGTLLDARRTGRYELTDEVCDCAVSETAAAGQGALRYVLVRFASARLAARTVGDVGPPRAPFTLPAGTVDTTLVPPAAPAVTPRLVVETGGRGNRLLDVDGNVTGTLGPLPGSAERSVVTSGAWYRFESLGGAAGRVDVVDPIALTAGPPGPTVPCAEIAGMSAASGRLLVACAGGDYYVFGGPST